MSQPTGRRLIAVVDDDSTILRALESLLDSADLDARLFTSASAMLDSGCVREIDCLVTDVDMPEMDGFELVRRVQALRPGLPTIVITGYPDTLNRLAKLDGVQPRFFTKPFQAPEFLAAVEESLSRGS